ncbi:MAG: adenylate/guanylate cyclase domain-containing protein, partial [Bacteroidota bacterium]
MLRHYILLLCCLFTLGLHAQTTAELEQQLTSASTDSDKLSLHYQLAELYLNHGNESKSIDHSSKAIELAKARGEKTLLVSSYLLNGKAYYNDREYRKAAAKYRNGLDYAKSVGEIELAIESYLELIQTTKRLRDDKKAARLAEESLTYLQQNSNYKKLKGREVSSRNEVAKIERERTALRKEKEKLQGEISSLRSNQAQLSNDNSRLSQQNTNLNRRQKELAQEKAAVEEEKAAVEEQVSQQQADIEQMSARQLKTQYLAERRAKLIDSLEHKREIDVMQLENKEVMLQNAELRLEQSRYVGAVVISLLLLVGLLARLFYNRYKTKKTANELLEEKNKTIAEERERSDELLLNILPANIADELKTTGRAKARKFPEVTVMFADFRNFTKMSEVLTPEQLVREIDECFKAFDMIISQYPEIEKIKTIGDAYMCASGLSDRKTLPSDIVQAALEFQEYLDEIKRKKRRQGLPYFEARIGLHTGPVVAGVVGSRKFAYDIWGDTVNTAARMEQKCEVGQVNISQSTYARIKYQFECQYRGRIEAKNKGMIEMYYVLKTVGSGAKMVEY